ncbi:hypothetical protein H0371_004481, partial [Salmonella enterica]|nr:hypothetical protein [Salmonella enterica]
TQQQQQDKIEINQSDGYAREVAKDFTEGARINNNNHFLYNLALEKLKRSPGQREYYEEIHKNICLNPYAKTINLECFLNDRVRATGKRKDAIKKALTIMVDKGVIEMDNKTISLPKKQAPIMSV